MLKITSEDIENKKFGHWTPLYKIGKVNRSVHWMCRCDCGKEKKIKQCDLYNVLYTKCIDCHNKELGQKKLKENSNVWKGYQEIHGNFWCSIKNSAKKRQIEFSISIEDAWRQFEKQNRCCVLSGIELKFAPSIKEQKELCTASLDRKDSSKGYTIDNIQWVHKDINKMKNTLDEKYFIETCKKIANHHSEDQ